VRLAVSIGCPSGIGPEVSVVAAAETCKRVGILLVGDVAAVVRAARGRGVERSSIRVPKEPEFDLDSINVWQPTKSLAVRDIRLGHPSRAGGAAQLAWIDAACDLVSRGLADALVTGPVSKDAIASSGAASFLGHTEYLQKRLRARDAVMAFATDRLTTALVTTHLALRDVPRAITADAVARATYWLGDYLSRTKGKARIVVAALNPHAGENGRMGDEEKRITAGIAKARKRLRSRVTIEGPTPAETAFRLASAGHYDGVVAMYHDQATIPMKLLGFGEAVNVTLGLPIVRTSVDHGTAYDRAPRFNADAQGMRAAMELAEKLAQFK
jgi:4-hydroxythreonine-4-phosphate dehydrogenase